MNKSMRNGTLMLLVIFLAAGPLLLIVPPVNAAPNKPSEVKVWFIPDNPYNDPELVPRWLIENVEFTWQLEHYEFPTDSIQLLKTNTYTIDLIALDQPGEIEVYLLLPQRYSSKIDELLDSQTFGIVQYGLPADFNDDGIVDGKDIHLISNAANNPNPYNWEYDLDGNGDINNLDVTIANTFKGQTASWDVSTSFISDITTVDGYYYVYSELWHFSGFGIRR